jgi:hypothetical protein
MSFLFSPAALRRQGRRSNGSSASRIQRGSFFEPLEGRRLFAVGPTVTEGVATEALFRITYAVDPAEPFSVDYQTEDRTAAAGSDYTPVGGTLTFGGGFAAGGVSIQVDDDPGPGPDPIVRETQTVRVPILNDSLREDTETFVLRLTDERVPTQPDFMTATIRNDDVVDVSVSDAGAVPEGTPPGAGRGLTFTVSLSRALPAGDPPVVIDYSTADGSAANGGGDYVPASGSVTFNPGGPTSRQVVVSTRPDAALETDEFFHLNISSSSVGVNITDGQGTGTILNDDIGVSVGDAAPVNEGDPPAAGGVLSFPVTLSRPLAAGEAPVSVWYSTANGTALDGPDFFGTVGKLEFTPGGPATLFANVQLQSDLSPEDNDTVLVVLGDPSGMDVVNRQASGTILNDDTPQELPVPVEADPVTEGNPGQAHVVRFVVDGEFVDPDLIADGIFYATADGAGVAGALAGSDYVSKTGQLRFTIVRAATGSAGGQVSIAMAPIGDGDPRDRTYQRRATVDVPIVGDSIAEGDESFFLVLTDTSGAEVGRAEGIIINDDGDASGGTVTPGPGTRFDWSMPPRFGLDVNQNGQIDMPLTSEYGSATRFEVDLDGTASRDASGNPPVRYEWSIDAGPGITTPIHFSGPQPVLSGAQALAQGDYTVTLDTQAADGTWSSATQTVLVKDYLIVAMGDSYGSGEGNPEVPAARDIDGNLDTIDQQAVWADGVTPDITAAHRRHHRSIYAGAAQAALELERSDPYTSVTFLFLSQSGAEVTKGVIAPYVPDPAADPKRVPAGWLASDGPEVTRWDRAQVDQARDLIGSRKVDQLTLSIGGNDTGFGPILSDLIKSDLAISAIVNGPLAAWAAYQFGLDQIWAGTDMRLAALRDQRYPALAAALSGPGGLGVAPGNVMITEYPDPSKDETGNIAPEIMGDIQWPLEVDSLELALALQHVFIPLNQTIQGAAAANGWHFVSGISSRFSTHGYSSSNPYLRTFKEATYLQGPGPRNALEFLGDPSTGTMHPNVQGQLVYRDALLRQIRQDLGTPDPAVVVASATGGSVVEGDSGTRDLLFTVTLSAPQSKTTTLTYTVGGGTATPGSDFTPRGGTLRFAPGTTSMTMRVPVVGDTSPEPDETVVLNLSAPQNAVVLSGQASGTIVNDDQPPARVTYVFLNGPDVSGATSTPDQAAFRARGGMDPTYGFAVLPASQAASFPWVRGVDQIGLRFDQSVQGLVEQGDLVVRGADGAARPFSGFAYDPVTRTAVWTLASSVTNNRLRMVFANAVLPGLDLRANVLSGDASGDGRVNALDLAFIKQRLNKVATNPGSGAITYSIFADLTGDGRINALDLSAARQRLNRALPTANSSVAATDLLFGSTRISPA